MAVSRQEFDDLANRHNALLVDHTALKYTVNKTHGLLQDTVTAQNQRLQEFEDKVKTAVAQTVAEADLMFGKHRETIEEHQNNFIQHNTDLEFLYSLASEEIGNRQNEVIQTKEEIQNVQSDASAGWNLHGGKLNAVYSEAAAGWQTHQERLDGLHEGVVT